MTAPNATTRFGGAGHAVRAAGAVLSGGASRRMGVDKALIEIDGVVLARRVHDALVHAGCSPVMAIGGDAGALAAHGLSVVADRHPGEGPLGAIITALEHLDDLDSGATVERPSPEVLVVVACDLVDADWRAVRAVIAPFDTDDEIDVVVPRSTIRRHMHHAAWHRRALRVLRDAFAEGERAPRRVLDRLRVHDLPLEGLDARWFADLDTPDELAARRACSGELT